MSLSPGAHLGPYEIIDQLGAGGMGEVYRAKDPRLGRDVAIKVLPAAVATDPDRRQRFDQEARAIAALAHPNIVTVHSIEEAGGAPFLTMELIEGQTIAPLIPPGGMALDQLLKIAIPLADAVAAAHGRGIMHRDLKPANVMVTAEGRVKVLDFGLAKLQEAAGSSGGLETRTASPLTGEGQIVGTTPYMSPEQAEGKPVDHRTDIFSLGVMLYEMATGARPFKGDSAVAVMAAIVRDTPEPISQGRPALPGEFDRIVRRCLVKDPARRYQTAADVRNDLEELKLTVDSGLRTAGTSAAAAARGMATRTKVIAAVGGAVVLTAAFLIWRLVSSGGPGLTLGTFTKLTSTGREADPSLSPDGQWVAYSKNANNNEDIYLQSVGGQTPINLTKDSPYWDDEPAFSPNGELIAFRSSGRPDGGIFIMGRTGESVRRLTTNGANPSWTPDGKFVVYAMVDASNPLTRGTTVGPSEAWKVDVSTGQASRISQGDVERPMVSPNGQRVAYWGLPVSTDTPIRIAGGNRDIWTMRIDGSDVVRVTDDPATDWSPTWSPDGRSLYFASDRGGTMNLWRVAIDQVTGKVRGDPEPVTTPAPFLGSFVFSSDGRRLAYASRTYISNVARIAFDPVKGQLVPDAKPIDVTTGTLAWGDGPVDPSPDDRELTLSSAYRQRDIYVIKPDGTGLRQLTSDDAKDRVPRWLDNRRIVFQSDRGGPTGVWLVNADGSGLRELIRQPLGIVVQPEPAPDGTRLTASVTAADNTSSIGVYPVQDGLVTAPTESLPLRPDGGQPGLPTWSPDGRRLAFSGFWVYSFQTRTYDRIATTGSVGVPRWLNDNVRILYSTPQDRCLLADTVTKQVHDVLTIADRGPVPVSCAISHDNRWIYYMHGSATVEIWMATLK